MKRENDFANTSYTSRLTRMRILKTRPKLWIYNNIREKICSRADRYASHACRREQRSVINMLNFLRRHEAGILMMMYHSVIYNIMQISRTVICCIIGSRSVRDTAYVRIGYIIYYTLISR